MLISVTLSANHSNLAGLWTNQKFAVEWGGVERSGVRWSGVGWGGVEWSGVVWGGWTSSRFSVSSGPFAEFEVEPGPSLTIISNQLLDCLRNMNIRVCFVCLIFH